MRFLLNFSGPTPPRAIEIQSPVGSQISLFRGREGHGRSFLKAVSWRTVGTVDTFIISFPSPAKSASPAAAIEVVTKIMIYGRVWAVIPWGHR